MATSELTCRPLENSVYANKDALLDIENCQKKREQQVRAVYDFGKTQMGTVATIYIIAYFRNYFKF